MPGFIHLHAKSHYSFLDGASTVDDLLGAPPELGQDALALTDTNGLYGAVRFWNAARERGIKPIFGAELHLVDSAPLTVLALDRGGRAAPRRRGRAEPLPHRVRRAARRREDEADRHLRPRRRASRGSHRAVR